MNLRDKFRSRRWFIQHLLTIEDQQGRRRPMGVPRPEQLQIIDAWDNFENGCVVKPRQIGASTIVQALSYRDAVLAPDPIRTLMLAHESGTVSRMNQMLRVFNQGMPEPIRPVLEVDNADTIQFAHNHASLMQYMAGGRGQGRSYTFQQFIAEEVAFWPVGSASVRGGAEADRNAWSSVLSTLHDSPYRKVWVVSTGDGPGGLYHDIALQARDNEATWRRRGAPRKGDWKLLFFRWFDFPFYEMDAEGFEPTAEDLEYADAFLREVEPTARLRKLAWRRWKHEQGYTPTRFRREYPSVFEDPFLLSSGTWFDAELAHKLHGMLPRHHRRQAFHGSERVYLRFDPNHRHFIGMDTSGGTGRDYAVVVVMRDDYEVCATWSSNSEGPLGQATAAAMLSAAYGKAVVLCEDNNYGRAVNNELERMGTPVWRNEQGKRFWSQRGRAGDSKSLVYAHARRMFNDGIACSADPERSQRIHDEDLLEQIGVVRESPNGNVEAPEGMHDDFVDAWAFALWCGKNYKAPDPEAPAARPTLRKLGWRK